MAPPQILCFIFSLLFISVVTRRPTLTARSPRKRSIQYTLRRAAPARYWTSAPSTRLAGGQLLVESGGLGAFIAPQDGPFLPRMTSPVVSAPPEVPGLEPTPVTYLPLPALMAALRGVTPATIGAGPSPAVCVHAHPVAAAPVTDLTAGDLLVPGRKAQTQTLRMLLSQLLPAVNLLAARRAVAGNTQRSPGTDLSLLGELNLGILNPALFRRGAAALSPSGVSQTHLRAIAAEEKNSVTERPVISEGNPDSEVFPRSASSAPVSGMPDDTERLSRLLSVDGDGWSSFIGVSRNKRSLPRTSPPEPRHQISAALGKIIRRIGFEKYGESLKAVVQDLQPLKEAMSSAQSDLNTVQNTFKKFETDLNQLLEQTRGAQQILLFILSSLFQENIVTRRKLEECGASNQVLTAELRFPSRSAEITTLRERLESKMRQYDALVLSLLKKKSALEVERQRLRQNCDIQIESSTEADPFSLSTFLSLMMGLGEPSGAQRDVNVLLMRLFPDLYPKAPSPPQTATLKVSNTKTGGAGNGWLQVLVPMMRTRHLARSVSIPVPLTAPRLDVPLAFSRQFLLRRPVQPRTAPLVHESVPPPPPPPDQGTDSGDKFIMRMLQLMLQMYNAQPGRLDENKIKEELVSFGRLLLC